MGAVERREDVLLGDMKAIDVVERSVPRLGDDRQRPIELKAFLHQPFDYRIAHDAHAVRVGDHHRTGEEAGFLEPGGTRHFAVAVEGEPAPEHGIAVRGAAREDRGDTGAHRSLSDDELPLSGDDRAMPNGHPRDVGNGVQRAGRAVEGNSKSAGAGTILCAKSLSCSKEDQRAETQDGAHCHDSVRTPFLEQPSEGFARPTDHKVGSTFLT